MTITEYQSFFSDIHIFILFSYSDGLFGGGGQLTRHLENKKKYKERNVDFLWSQLLFFITSRIYVLLREAFSSEIIKLSLPYFLLVVLWFHFSSSHHWAIWNAFWCKTESGSSSFSRRLPLYPSPVQ